MGRRKVVTMSRHTILFVLIYMTSGYTALGNLSGRVRIGLMLLCLVFGALIIKPELPTLNALRVFWTENRQPLFLCGALVVLSALSMVFNREGIYQYLILWSMLLMGFSAWVVIGKDEFRVVFVNQMVFLSAWSLLMFFANLAFPQIVGLFPKVQNSQGLIAIDTGFAVLMPNKPMSSPRNWGVFWEPGAYQTFLNLALMLELFYSPSKLSTNHSRKSVVVILMLTIMTTASTTGIMVMMLVSLSYVIHSFGKRLRNGVWHDLGIMVSVVLAIAVFAVALEFLPYYYKNAAYGKLAKEVRTMDWSVDIANSSNLPQPTSLVSPDINIPDEVTETKEVINKALPSSIPTMEATLLPTFSDFQIANDAYATPALPSGQIQEEQVLPNDLPSEEKDKLSTNAYESGRIAAFAYPFKLFISSPIWGGGFQRLKEIAYDAGYLFNTFTPVNWFAENGLLYGLLINISFAGILFLFRNASIITKFMLFVALFASIATEDYSRSALIFAFVFWGSSSYGTIRCGRKKTEDTCSVRGA